MAGPGVVGETDQAETLSFGLNTGFPPCCRGIIDLQVKRVGFRFERGWMRKLEPGQLELARLIEEGLTYDEMADRLGISSSTVKKHTDRLRWALGVEKKRHIPKVLRDLGLLDDHRESS